MWLKWLPWRYVIKRIARAQGFADPMVILSHLARFAKPAEVAVPVELLRAGAVLHARGLINGQAIQHNLDWVWPYWVTMQFNPKSASFIPRAFSLTHINLTQRNWTAAGLPDLDVLPVVDPRGAVMPFFDSWTIDAWIITSDGRALLPSREERAQQMLDREGGLSVVTTTTDSALSLQSRTRTISCENAAACCMELQAHADTMAWLAVSVRPCNPEGISFVHSIAPLEDKSGFLINDEHTILFSTPAAHVLFADYHAGDVFHLLQKNPVSTNANGVTCDVGLATAAAVFSLPAGETRAIKLTIPLGSDAHNAPAALTDPNRDDSAMRWERSLDTRSRITIPDEHFSYLYNAALRTLVLHSPVNDCYAGPFTYKRFWIRDATYIAYALLCAGLTERARTVIEQFPKWQKASGYFVSQVGEWDSNGQVLWIMEQYCAMTGRKPPAHWQQPIKRGTQWIIKKRVTRPDDPLHNGLLPPGFSAEHLGPNDYYYWDDFWSIAGLEAAQRLLVQFGDHEGAATCIQRAADLREAVTASLREVQQRLGNRIIPAAPTRRPDSGAVGSLVCSYPLQLSSADDNAVQATASYLYSSCLHDGAFFHDIIHSGINAYLTLHLAQTLLRAGDMRALELMNTIAELASTTGQWPEAIHPRLKSGCMGDGQHAWAAAEWILMLRNCLIREDQINGKLIFCSGLPADWLSENNELSITHAPTRYGTVSLHIACARKSCSVCWQGDWHEEQPTIEIRLPAGQILRPAPEQTSVTIQL